MIRDIRFCEQLFVVESDGAWNRDCFRMQLHIQATAGGFFFFFFGAPLHRTADKIDGWWGIRFLDQRGTGLSTPVSPSTLGSRGDDQVQTRYLQSFRADSIAHDAEGA